MSKETFKTLRSLPIENKRLLIRADFNVPIENGKITDMNRITAFIPTLRECLARNPERIVMMSHLGEPKEHDVKFSLKPVAEALTKALSVGVNLVSIEELASKEKGIYLLENLRFNAGEKKNCPEFASKLATLGDVYINDAFATAHRKHASIYATAERFKDKGLGLLFQHELEAFEKGLHAPKKPLTLILGGSKVSSKFKVLKNIAHLSDNLIIGGAMANTFLFALKGVDLGKSLFEPELKEEIIEFVNSIGKTKLILPEDVIVATGLNAERCHRRCIDEIQADEMALDIGPKSLEKIATVINDSNTIVWNGPLGAFEFPNFANGTISLAKLISQNSAAYSIVGGGDTDAAIHMAGVVSGFSYMSTGGGAFLQLLEGETLPAIEAILAP